MGNLITCEEAGTRTTGGIMARQVSEGDKLQGNSLPEIRDCWQQATLDLGREPGIRDAARGALRPGNLLNAFVLWCLSRPEEEVRDIAAWGLRALERLKDSDGAVDLRRLDREDFGSLGGLPDKHVDAAAAKRPRGARRHPDAGRPGQSKRTG